MAAPGTRSSPEGGRLRAFGVAGLMGEAACVLRVVRIGNCTE